MAAPFAGISLERPVIMGIVNATPDSFSDGGDAFKLDDAVARGLMLAEQGAAIIDIGGESTRPGAEPVSIAQEIARTRPVVERLAAQGLTVSIDTRNAQVMEAAVEAGATIINDVTALSYDPRALDVAVASSASVVLMHMQGQPGTMQQAPHYDHAAEEVFAYLKGRIAACERAGISRDRIAVDPGIGFGKTLAHNLEILNRLDLYQGLGVALLVGVSRKRFIEAISGETEPKRRLPGSIAAALAAVDRGAQIVRVHDVAETAQALAVWDGIKNGG